jgi:hypothetical protein
MQKPLLSIAAVIITIAIAIQFIPYGKNHTNPPTLGEPTWDSPRTKELFDQACADCHSHETSYPWYANIAPISWLVAHDVEDGRKHFNISTWGQQAKNKGDEAHEEVSEGDMPMLIYTWLHSKAQLSANEKEELTKGLKATFPKHN